MVWVSLQPFPDSHVQVLKLTILIFYLLEESKNIFHATDCIFVVLVFYDNLIT